MPIRSRLLSLLVLAAFALLACDGLPSPEPRSAAGPVEPGAEPAPSTPAFQAEAVPTEVPGVAMAASAAPAPAETGALERVAASHILVSHVGAAAQPLNVHRSENDARRKGEDLLGRLRAGEDFATLAKQESDDTSRVRGGFLGGFNRGTMALAFEQAAFALPVGSISEVVQTPFGFHILRREPLAEVHVAQILFQWQGAPGSVVERSNEEARAKAEDAWARLQAGAAFAEVARDCSDGAAGLRGGDLGWFTRGQFLPAWEERAFSLAPGQTSPPFETSVGFHIVQRLVPPPGSP